VTRRSVVQGQYMARASEHDSTESGWWRRLRPTCSLGKKGKKKHATGPSGPAGLATWRGGENQDKLGLEADFGP
jgi:hypothetical protein